jgi:hypothetical protein
MISNLTVLLSTLRNPQKITRIRIFVRTFSFLDLDACSPSEPETWERLDDLLCGLCPGERKGEGAGLTFQIASRGVTLLPIPSRYLVKLLPKFSRIGNCEEVEF